MAPPAAAANSGKHAGSPPDMDHGMVSLTRQIISKAPAAVLAELGVPESALSGEPCACPAPGCEEPDFRWHDSSQLFTCGSRVGDALALLIHVNQWTVTEAAHAVLASGLITLTNENYDLEQASAEAAAIDRRRHLENKQAQAGARVLWQTAEPADPQHPYLQAHGINAHGIRQFGDRLFIPMCDALGDMRNLWWIDRDGQQGRLLAQGSTEGLIHLVGHVRTRHPEGAPADPPTICLAEDFAGAATLYDAVGHPTACAFGATNLTAAAESLISRHPGALILVCPYTDSLGTTSGHNAATAVGGRMIAPFPVTDCAGSSKEMVRAAFEFAGEGQ